MHYRECMKILMNVIRQTINHRAPVKAPKCRTKLTHRSRSPLARRLTLRTAAMIDSAHSADAPADAQTAADDDCKQPADTNRLQRISITFDHANADLAVSAITSLEQTYQFPTKQQIQA
jgi:hypothetical protein